MATQGINMDDDDAGDWAGLCWGDLEADLRDAEEVAMPDAPVQLGPETTEEDLRLLLQQRAAVPNFDVDSLFAASRALRGIAADLQGALTQVESLQFASAALVASLTHGPLKAPSAPSICSGFSAEEVFGLSAAAAAPPPLELELPAEASSLVSYQQRLAALPRALFVPRQIRLCMRDVNQYQDTKDINRDELVINGKPISGARGGYAAAVSEIAGALRAAASDDGGQKMADDAEEKAAQLLLSTLNRTASGFYAFEQVLRLFNCPEATIVAPESAAARPLEALVIGGLSLGRAHTRYSIRRSDGSGRPLAMVDAVFGFRVPTSTLRRLVEVSTGDRKSVV